MQILTAEHAGFCEGVERAFRIAIDTAKAGKSVFMLGNLVHNKQVVERLKSFGVQTVNEISEIPAGTKGILMISAHGVAPQVYEEAKKLNLEIVDTTCPWVKKPQKIAKDLAQEGRLVIIFGDKKHPEVKGVAGWTSDLRGGPLGGAQIARGGRSIIIENESDLDKLALDPNEKVGILAQTTQVEEDFDRIAAKLKSKVKDVKEYDTICGATSKRQKAAVELAQKVDLMLVVGDVMSANTKRLRELCEKTGTVTHQIQTAQELDLSWLKGKERVGLTAGASTPEWVINEVAQKLKSYYNSPT